MNLFSFGKSVTYTLKGVTVFFFYYFGLKSIKHYTAFHGKFKTNI